ETARAPTLGQQRRREDQQLVFFTRSQFHFVSLNAWSIRSCARNGGRTRDVSSMGPSKTVTGLPAGAASAVPACVPGVARHLRSRSRAPSVVPAHPQPCLLRYRRCPHPPPTLRAPCR